MVVRHREGVTESDKVVQNHVKTRSSLFPTLLVEGEGVSAECAEKVYEFR